MFSCKCCCKCFLLIIIFLQLLTTIERQVFDFLGHMWTPILVNFVTILFIILGLFGVQQRRKLYLVLYAFSQILTLFWNAFIIFFYLEIGSHFSRDGDLHWLNLGTGARSWWVLNAPKCSARNLTSSSSVNTVAEDLAADSRHIYIKPVLVQQCILDYYYIESLQSALQIILSLFAVILTTALMFKFYKNSYSDGGGRRNGMETGHLPPYSITLSPRTLPTRRSMGGPSSSTTNGTAQRNKRSRSSTRSSKSHRSSSRRRKSSGGGGGGGTGTSSRAPPPPHHTGYNHQDTQALYSREPSGHRYTPQHQRRHHHDTSSLDSFAPNNYNNNYDNYGGGPQVNPAFFGGSQYSVYSLNPRPLRHSPIYMNSETRI